MAVNLPPPAQLLPVPGVRIGTACASIKQSDQQSDQKNDRADLALFDLVEGTQVGGVYTQSHFAAAPVTLAQERQTKALSWVVNSGNANAATGEEGIADAKIVCAHAARLLQRADIEIQPFSTGVIGERLPVSRMTDGLNEAYSELSEDGWLAAAEAIMTTDTVPKGYSKQIELGGATVTITGIAKGSGMIKPNMATMLAYMACDAQVTDEMAQALVDDAVKYSFNRITVDGDTSTNDCFMLACTQLADHPLIDSRAHPLYEPLLGAVSEIAGLLAHALVRDGEGATKFITVKVSGGQTEADCLAVAYTIAESPLVKTAMFAGDANWGRFCMAIGRAPISTLDTSGVQLWLDDVQVAKGGLIDPNYAEAAGARVLAQDEFTVHVDLGAGECSETVWTTDLSYDYVRINAEYRT